MPFITKAPTTLTALTHQVFAIHGAGSVAATKQAQAALREANPHWGDQAKLPAGTLVIVPPKPGARATAPQPVEVINAATVEQLKQVLAAAQAVLEKSVAGETQEVNTSLALAKTRELVALAKENPELRDRLAQINEQGKIDLEQIAAGAKVSQQGLAQLAKDLGSLSS